MMPKAALITIPMNFAAAHACTTALSYVGVRRTFHGLCLISAVAFVVHAMLADEGSCGDSLLLVVFRDIYVVSVGSQARPAPHPIHALCSLLCACAVRSASHALCIPHAGMAIPQLCMILACR